MAAAGNGAVAPTNVATPPYDWRRSDVYSIPMVFDPMLATSGPLPEDDGRWAYEPKWDGFRALVHVSGRVMVWSRRGTDLTARFPELAGLGTAVPGDTVLDGELVILDDAGRTDFEAIRRRGLLGRVEVPATFVAFDVLLLGGREMFARSFRARRAALEGLAFAGPNWVTTPSHPGDGGALFEATREQGLEGVVAKRLDSPYRPGVRTKLWTRRSTGSVAGSWLAASSSGTSTR